MEDILQEWEGIPEEGAPNADSSSATPVSASSPRLK